MRKMNPQRVARIQEYYKGLTLAHLDISATLAVTVSATRAAERIEQEQKGGAYEYDYKVLRDSPGRSMLSCRADREVEKTLKED